MNTNLTTLLKYRYLLPYTLIPATLAVGGNAWGATPSEDVAALPPETQSVAEEFPPVVVIETMQVETMQVETMQVETMQVETMQVETSPVTMVQSSPQPELTTTASKLEAANLEAANLEAANLEAANLESADLEAATLEPADLEPTDPEPATLTSERSVPPLVSVAAADLLPPSDPIAATIPVPAIPVPAISAPAIPTPTMETAPPEMTPGQLQIPEFAALGVATPEQPNTAAPSELVAQFSQNPVLLRSIPRSQTTPITRPLEPAIGQSNQPSILPQPATPILPDNSPSLIPSAPPSPETATPTPAFTDPIAVQDIQVSGSTIFDQTQLEAAIQSYEGRSLTAQELQQAVDAITQLYLNEGYITSRAKISSPIAATGNVDIQVIEGRIDDITVEGTDRLSPAYVRSRVRLGTGVPLNANRLEQQLRLLRDDPLFDSVEASLRPATEEGVSTLVVRVDEANETTVGLNFDNYSPPSVGSERVGLDLRFQDLTGIGDVLTMSYYRSLTGGANLLDFAYQVPVNPMNGTILLRVSPYRNEITADQFDDLEITSSRDQYELTFRQPLVRSPNEEFALSLGFVHQNGQTFVFDQPTPFGIGPEADGTTRTSVIQFGQDYLSRDRQGLWLARSQFNLGIDALDATIHSDGIPDGRFFSWLAQAQRYQYLNEDHLLVVQADLQLTPDALLPAHQFVIGGGQSVRGYRQSARSGDNGFRLSVEDRIALDRDKTGAPIVQLAPFIDMGKVWNQGNNPNKLPDQTFLISAGLGLLLNNVFGMEGVSARLDYGFPIVDLADRGDNLQDNGIHFSLRYQF